MSLELIYMIIFVFIPAVYHQNSLQVGLFCFRTAGTDPAPKDSKETGAPPPHLTDIFQTSRAFCGTSIKFVWMYPLYQKSTSATRSATIVPNLALVAQNAQLQCNVFSIFTFF